MKHCPHCGQEWPGGVRLRTRLSPIKARILDTIARAGANGISMTDLHAIMGEQSHACLKVHINQLNKLIDDDGLFIAGHRLGNYVLKQKRRIAA